MRLFIAINFSEKIKNLIEKKVELLKNSVDEKVKWVKKENWHITIKFLGEVEEKKLPKIKNKIKEIKEFNDFYFQINRIDSFPNINYPKIVYLGIDSGKEKLKEINNEIEIKLSQLNFKKEKQTFTPHITIGRSKDYTDNSKLSNTIKKFYKKRYFINIYVPVDKISLMKSELTPEGPQYEEIFSKNIK